jgi:hypothetical protein
MLLNLSGLTPQQVSQILNCLAERPYKEVNILIAKIHGEASKQVAEYEKANGNNGPISSDSGRG